MVTSRIMIVCQAVAQFADKTSACSRTVSVAISCLSFLVTLSRNDNCQEILPLNNELVHAACWYYTA